MSELILLRHGQASFGSDNYDRLSATGHQQVAVLADYWRALELRFDQVYTGELRRQQETAAALLPLSHGGSAARVHGGFNEYDGDPLIRIYLRDHAQSDGFDPSPELPIHDRRLFQQVLEAATARWLAGELEPAAGDIGFESWPAFTGRVRAALDELMTAHPRGERILDATSGGVIAVAMQHVLSLPDHKTIATNWVVNNSSVTRILYNRQRTSLHQFNGLAHLENPRYRSLITFR